jgi:hypothetical protein
MDLDWIIRLVLLGIMHWVLAIMMLQDLVTRRRIIGGLKWPWAVAIVFVTFVGSVIYLLCHPRVIIGDDQEDEL